MPVDVLPEPPEINALAAKGGLVRIQPAALEAVVSKQQCVNDARFP